VDLGCGDFNIGSQLVGETKSYIACDIVPELITHHRSKYLNSNLQFFEVNMINDVLPEGEVVTIRQVLQHLNNKQIGQVIPKLAKYKYLILTEHLPNGEFEPNKDKDTGPDIRTAINSGVVLTSPPFNLKTKETKILCEVKLPKGNIQTVLYTM
jgi:hypothetical protein